jgi:aspartyl-tRNA(Asn)/glutamyl-tRNA(Gln) amidotransferase subunit A
MNVTRREFTALAASAAAYYALGRRGLAQMSGAAPSDDLTGLSLAAASARLRAGSVTSTQLTEACLSRIAVYNPKLDAFITVMRDKALAQAARCDAEIKAGKFLGPLHGIPLALKDNIDTAGTRTTAGSAVFEDRVPTEDATVTTRLLAAGAVIIGKANLEEFAMGGGETSYWGPARNPWALDHNTGGSSAGSGAATAADLCFGALGTDTGGSIRMPASYCGLVGMKPTYGLVPIRGIVPLRVSFDHCGPMTRTVEDAAIMLNCLAGYDKLDITSVEHPKEDYVEGMKQPVSGLRLGLPVSFFDDLDPEVAQAVQTAIGVLSKLTAGSKEVVLPSTLSLAGGGGGSSAEMWAYHEELYKKGANRYMLPHRRRLEASAASNGGNAADYVRQMWALQLLRRTIDDAFTDFDLVVMPTQRILPPLLNDLVRRAHDSKPSDPLGTSNCPPFDVLGTPALSINCGFSKGGLPIGLMISGPRFSESKIFALARAYEQATDWHLRKPPLTPDTVKPPVVTS